MSCEERAEHGEGEAPSDEERYGALQTGYREALLVQLDLAITELEQQGDFTADQIKAAVEIRLAQGRDALRSHKLAEAWEWPPGSR